MLAQYSIDVTIDVSESTTISLPFSVGGLVPVALILPATFTGTAMTFQVSIDGSTYLALNSDTAAISVTVANGKFISIATFSKHFRGAKYAKLVSGSAENADRVIKVILADPETV
jgi:hypothetical protein